MIKVFGAFEASETSGRIPCTHGLWQWHWDQCHDFLRSICVVLLSAWFLSPGEGVAGTSCGPATNEAGVEVRHLLNGLESERNRAAINAVITAVQAWQEPIDLDLSEPELVGAFGGQSGCVGVVGLSINRSNATLIFKDLETGETIKVFNGLGLGMNDLIALDEAHHNGVHLFRADVTTGWGTGFYASEAKIFAVQGGTVARAMDFSAGDVISIGSISHLVSGIDFQPQTTFRRTPEGPLELTVSPVATFESARPDIPLPSSSYLFDEDTMTFVHRTGPDVRGQLFQNLFTEAVITKLRR